MKQGESPKGKLKGPYKKKNPKQAKTIHVTVFHNSLKIQEIMKI